MPSRTKRYRDHPIFSCGICDNPIWQHEKADILPRDAEAFATYFEDNGSDVHYECLNDLHDEVLQMFQERRARYFTEGPFS